MESTSRYEINRAVQWLIEHSSCSIERKEIGKVTRIIYERDHFFGSYEVHLWCKDSDGHEAPHYHYYLSLDDFHSMMSYADLELPYIAESTVEIIQMGEYDTIKLNEVLRKFSSTCNLFEKTLLEESRLAIVRYDCVDDAVKAFRKVYGTLHPKAEPLPFDTIQFSYRDIIIRMAKRSQAAIDRLIEEKRKAEEEKRLEQERISYCRLRQNDAVLLVIPDVHGRTFWKEATNQHPNIPLVFLGDYLDPYHNHLENISPEEAIVNFRDILDFKKKNSDRVTLLLGNHDIHYIAPDLNCSRKDTKHEEELRKLYVDNLSQFLLIAQYTIAKKKFVMSHAGILKGWLEMHYPDTPLESIDEIITNINNANSDERMLVQFIKSALMDVPYSRGGGSRTGSIVWADESEHEHCKEPISGIYQIFGHTQRLKDPFITDKFANLDCRKAFIITKNGEILESMN